MCVSISFIYIIVLRLNTNADVSVKGMISRNGSIYSLRLIVLDWNVYFISH